MMAYGFAEPPLLVRLVINKRAVGAKWATTMRALISGLLIMVLGVRLHATDTVPVELVSELSRDGCAISNAMRKELGGLRLGQQVRVLGANDKGFAVFTVYEGRSPQRVGMSAEGLQRCGLHDGDRVRVAAQPFISTLSPQEARQRDEATELVRRTGVLPNHKARLLLLVPHGGQIETGTDTIAERMLADNRIGPTVCWQFLGYKAGSDAFARWHITSTDIEAASFPALAGLVASQDRYELAVSLHGHRATEILIGGRATEEMKNSLRSLLVTGLPDVAVRVVGLDENLAGSAAGNIVNRWSTCGIQLELPLVVRTRHIDTLAAILVGFVAKAKPPL